MAKGKKPLISEEKREKLKQVLKDMFTNTNHEGYAETVIFAIEFILAEVFGDKLHSATPEKKPDDPVEDPK